MAKYTSFLIYVLPVLFYLFCGYVKTAPTKTVLQFRSNSFTELCPQNNKQVDTKENILFTEDVYKNLKTHPTLNKLLKQAICDLSSRASEFENNGTMVCQGCCKIVKAAVPYLKIYEPKVQQFMMTECDILPQPTKDACEYFAKNVLPNLLNKYLSDPGKMASILCEIMYFCPLDYKC